MGVPDPTDTFLASIALRNRNVCGQPSAERSRRCQHGAEREPLLGAIATVSTDLAAPLPHVLQLIAGP